MPTTTEQAIQQILDALTIEGPHPPTHRADLARLRREWPTLYAGLVMLAQVRGVTLPPH